MKNRILLFLCFNALLCFPIAAENHFSDLHVSALSTRNILPNDDVQYIYQDKEGYIWFATRNGLYRYDGYTIRALKSDIHTPTLLTNNNIYCVTEDNANRMWLGMDNGLNMLDKTTGKVSKIELSCFHNNSITRILVYEDELFLCTETGLMRYFPDNDSIIIYGLHNTNGVLPMTPIKCAYLDSQGQIWIGTWQKGLFRYDPEKNEFHAYPQLNPQNSAHVIFEDSYHRIWVGTWGYGLVLLDTPYNVRTTWQTYVHRENDNTSIADNIIYAIAEDKNNNSLWVGTRYGLSVMSMDQLSKFRNYYPTDENAAIPGNEIDAVMADNQGNMWLGMVGGGVLSVITRKPDFQKDNLSGIRQQLLTASVRSIMADSDGLLWMGIGSSGFVIQDRKTGKWIFYKQHPDFRQSDVATTVMCLTQSRHTGKIWIGTYDGGVFVYDKSAPVGMRVKNYYRENEGFLPGNRVYAIKEDRDGNLWFATHKGLGMLSHNGDSMLFDKIHVDGRLTDNLSVQDIAQDSTGNIWLATLNCGVLCLRKSDAADAVNGYECTDYTINNGKLNTMMTTCVHVDVKGKIWVGSAIGGLNMYSPEDDAFVCLQHSLRIQSDGIFSIQGDKAGKLWLGTGDGLLCLDVADTLSASTYRLFTVSDGLNDNAFNRNVSCVSPDGEMFFGNHNGYTCFYPERIVSPVVLPKVHITDIKIFNNSWQALDDDTRKKVSPLSPAYTDQIVLNYRQNNFTIEFAALDYADPIRNKYAFQLEGFDEEWRYTDASRRFAYYNNLPYGNYTFKLKATNSNISWDKVGMVTLKIRLVPPVWRRWWAYLIYFLLLCCIAYVVFMVTRKRILLQNELHLREMDKLKSEELSHAKLQFFTNITHELLTPLTIISATIDELKVCAPKQMEYYHLMGNNINRLIRLIQQILEFRKAETGNLKLKVSRGDLVWFIRTSVDSFLPLMKKKNIHVSFVCQQETLLAYFDPDKIDKVLYNLLSNAVKYNLEDSEIMVKLSYDADADFAILQVKDNGPGMSAEAQKNLFKRFYEGDYRKFHTIGTGIGLSLCRDLMSLHRGSISVESELGKGTCFKVVFPVNRDAYQADEVDETITIMPVAEDMPHIADAVANEELVEENNKEYALLLIEDNEELLRMMTHLLSKDYIVYTATNGKEGLEVIEREYIDLIVSDVMMPEMDGMEFCRSLKGNIETSHIPIILLTAKQTPQDRVDAYDAGADAFISKPFNLSLLHSRIINLLKARERVNKDFKKQLVFEAKSLNYTSIDETFLRKAVDCVHKHLDDSEFDQFQFVSEMGTSKSTLFRKLKSLTGLSSSAFIRNIRLKAACQIMNEKRSIRVSELAYAVGFNDPKYFSSCFKKEFGMQPSEYMSKQGAQLEEE